MSSWHSYPKVYGLGHAATVDLLRGPVTVTEKVDGSQFSVMMNSGKLKVRSKGKEMQWDHPEKMFAGGVEEALKRRDLLHPGWTYRGEYLQKPKHNALAYSRAPNGHVILFDINTDEEVYLPYHEMAGEAERVGWEAVPLLYEGIVESANDLRGMLQTQSVLGGQRIEGVVVKPIAYDLFGRDGKVVMGKFVSEDYKEVQRTAWKTDNPRHGDVMRRICEALRTEARWRKGVQHLRERGELQNAPQDIGPLLREVQSDVLSEEKEQILETWWRWAKPQIGRAVIRGLPEWYKQQLLEGVFDVELHDQEGR